MQYEELLEDVRTGRRKIQKISHSCEGVPEIVVEFNDGLAHSVTVTELKQLLSASEISQAADLSFEGLVAALDGRENDH